MSDPSFTFTAPCGCRYENRLADPEPALVPCGDHPATEVLDRCRAALMAQMRGNPLTPTPRDTTATS